MRNSSTENTDGSKDDPEYKTAKMPAEHTDCIKWVCDGAATIAEVAQHFQTAADQFKQLAQQDAMLLGPVDNGFVHYVVPGHDIDVEVDKTGKPVFNDELMCPFCYKITR